MSGGVRKPELGRIPGHKERVQTESAIRLFLPSQSAMVAAAAEAEAEAAEAAEAAVGGGSGRRRQQQCHIS